MKRWVTVIAYAVLAPFLARVPAASAMLPDPTGLWYDANESGWGLTVVQQQLTLFAVLFVYDSSGRATWYVASDIGGAIDIDPPPPSGGPYAGALYRTTGPWFGGAFDPAAVTMAQVGTLSIGYADSAGATLTVDYTIDGVHVHKTVERLTWVDGYDGFSGVYQGAAVLDTAQPGCPAITLSPPLGTVTAFNVAAVHANHETRITWGTGIDTACTIDGTYRQAGQVASIAGTLGCGPVGATPPALASALLTGISFNAAGFGARFQLEQGNCTYTGHLGGVRLPG